MTRNRLIAMHGELERKENSGMSDLRDVLLAAFITAVFIAALYGFFS